MLFDVLRALRLPLFVVDVRQRFGVELGTEWVAVGFELDSNKGGSAI